MIPRKDALTNPFLRGYVVCLIYRNIIKQTRLAFDPVVKKFLQKETIKFKK